MSSDAEDNSDLLSMLDIEQGGSDPDLDDFRDEFRPNLRSRFEGWTTLAPILKGGNVSLTKLYGKAIELMPFLKASDVVTEMIARLVPYPSMHHEAVRLQSFLDLIIDRARFT